ncbi:MAG TPA: CTP synthase [bacterium]|nr:CTP synthase [bacterium]HPJ71581.1 CTP synthase [bacterium]HPQ67005.1 CTP synthase [bacterium]
MAKIAQTRYIIITGGVVSSLGKGITAASIGCLLKSRGLRVNMLKFDPYLNVDPGTMSPYQHGEVFVTDDGAETDLDLGHYERFLDQMTRRENNVTAGQIYAAVLSRERDGGYLGKTVQVVPHVTDEIKDRIRAVSPGCEVVIVEVGGTVGDIESLPFLEAVRQLSQEEGEARVCHVHLTLVPYIRAAEELKTKPTQHSVAKLREIGIRPQVLICRTEYDMPESMKAKIALFCNVERRAVIQEKDVGASIYSVPLLLRGEGLDRLILELLALPQGRSNLGAWRKMVAAAGAPGRPRVVIAVAGKYTELKDAYKSIRAALQHAAGIEGFDLEIRAVDVEEAPASRLLKGVDGVLVPGGFGDRGVEGKIGVVGYARRRGLPFLGICLGMQAAVIDYARGVAGLSGAHSTEFDPGTPHPVITMMEEQKRVRKLGGTMRLGGYSCELLAGSRAAAAYGKNAIRERHRHRYEFNAEYRRRLEEKGLRITGVNPETGLVEVVEIPAHPWFVAVQFHPEFTSRPLRGHPLFRAFVRAAARNRLRP